MALEFKKGTVMKELGKDSVLSPRQEEILDETLQLVRESGLSNLTIRRVAERVGFSEPALYRHFPTKQSLILGLMTRLEEMLLGRAQEILEESGKSARERLEEVLHFHLDLNQKNNSLPILLLAEASSSGDAELIARMQLILKNYLNLLQQLVEEGQSEETFVPVPEPDCLALLILGLPAAFAIRHRLNPSSEFEERVKSSLVPFLMQSLRLDQGGER